MLLAVLLAVLLIAAAHRSRRLLLLLTCCACSRARAGCCCARSALALAAAALALATAALAPATAAASEHMRVLFVRRLDDDVLHVHALRSDVMQTVTVSEGGVGSTRRVAGTGASRACPTRPALLLK